MSLKVVAHPRSKNLYLRGNVRGQDVYESTKTDSQEAAEALRIKREGELLDATIFGAKSVTTFAQAAVKYLKGGGSARYLGEYDERTGEWTLLIGIFGSRKLLTITQEDLDAAAQKLYPGTTAATRNRCAYTPFVAVWSYAAGDSLCDTRTWRRPSDRKSTKTATKPQRRGAAPVSYELAAAFLAAMSPAAGITMTILFYTGLRPIELFTMTADDVMPDRQWMVVNSSKNNGEPRGVPMHRCLVPLMTILKARGGALVRTYKGVPYEPKDEGGGQMKSAINGAAKRSGIKDISPYTARHSVSTQLVIEGVHPHVKDQILGHAVTDMSRRYTKVPQMPLIEAMDLLPVPAGIPALPWIRDPAAALSGAKLLPLSPEAREKQRKARKAFTRPSPSPETREKISLGMLARRKAERETKEES